MKKVALLLLVVGTFTVVGLSQTTVDINWDTWGGNVAVDFQSDDDAHASLLTAGNHIFGNFSGIDYADNPYNYLVDTTRAQVRGNIENGGFIEFMLERQDSWTSMYGPPGQVTYTYLETSDKGFFATNTRTNYADMITHNYGYQANDQWTATGDFLITHYIHAGNPLYGAGFQAQGSGSVDVTLMSSEARRENAWRFGEGAGCYTNAHASGAGTGSFVLQASAPNHISAFGASIGGGNVQFIINYTNGFNTANNLNMSGN